MYQVPWEPVRDEQVKSLNNYLNGTEDHFLVLFLLLVYPSQHHKHLISVQWVSEWFDDELGLDYFPATIVYNVNIL